MNRRIVPLFAITAAALFSAGCSNTKAKISGQFAGSDKETVKLSVLHTSEARIVDSTVTDSKGNFTLKLDLSDGHERIVNLLYNNKFITLIVAPGDHIKVNALACNFANYTVRGSQESELVREINNIIFKGVARLDSLAQRPVTRSEKQEDRTGAAIEYMRELQSLKRKQLVFIQNNSKSLAALYALNQKLPNEQYFFTANMDMRYSHMLADSLQQSYPDSPYLKNLQKNLEAIHKKDDIMNMLNTAMENPESFPEIELNDMYGKCHSLSSLKGNVIIVDFWSGKESGGPARNAEMKVLYDRFSDQGLSVYQINLDPQKADWVNAVQRQNLPWTSVHDVDGLGSKVAATFNIKDLPANYIIDKRGNIVGKNVFGKDLERLIEAQIKKP